MSSSNIATASQIEHNQNVCYSSDDDMESQFYHYVLAPESDLTSHDTESVCSIHDKSTDIAKDTSDTSSESSLYTEGMEFDVYSLSESEQFIQYPNRASSSSEPNDILPRLVGTGLITVKELEDNNSADDNKSSTDSNSAPIKKRFTPHHHLCVRCKYLNIHPQFSYCMRCYRLRKDFLPSRPNHKKKMKAIKPTSSNVSEMSPQTITTKDSPETIDSKKICRICKLNPKDGVFMHTYVVHVFACYKCCLELFKINKTCPVCNSKAYKVGKSIIV